MNYRLIIHVIVNTLMVPDSMESMAYVILCTFLKGF